MKGGSTVTSKVYEPYAQALLSLGQSNNLVDALTNDVDLIAETLKGSSELTDFLANPFILDTVPANVNTPATTGADHINNIEQDLSNKQQFEVRLVKAL